MLEAVHADLVFTISLKRSTQNLQLSTSSPADYPIYRIAALRQVTFRANKRKLLAFNKSRALIFQNFVPLLTRSWALPAACHSHPQVRLIARPAWPVAATHCREHALQKT